MRTKALVPVGQGCGRLKHQVTLVGEAHNGRCKCHPDLYLNLCVGCHEWFHSSMPHTKTCSDKCRKRLSRSRSDKFLQLVLTYANGTA